MSDSAALDTAVKIAEIIGIGGGLIGGIGGMIVVVYRLGRMSERVEGAITVQGENIAALQADVRSLNEVVTRVALQGQRLDTQDRRLDLMEQRWEDLRRGEGWQLPLMRDKARE